MKLSQLLIDGDVESNPGPTYNVDQTPTKSMGRPKGTPKKKGFKTTPKKFMNLLEDSGESGGQEIINYRKIQGKN